MKDQHSVPVLVTLVFAGASASTSTGLEVAMDEDVVTISRLQTWGTDSKKSRGPYLDELDEL